MENTASPARLANLDEFTSTALVFDSEDRLHFTKPEQLPEAVLASGNMFIITGDGPRSSKTAENGKNDRKQDKLFISAGSAAVVPGAINSP